MRIQPELEELDIDVSHDEAILYLRGQTLMLCQLINLSVMAMTAFAMPRASDREQARVHAEILRQIIASSESLKLAGSGANVYVRKGMYDTLKQLDSIANGPSPTERDV